MSSGEGSSLQQAHVRAVRRATRAALPPASPQGFTFQRPGHFPGFTDASPVAVSARSPRTVAARQDPGICVPTRSVPESPGSTHCFRNCWRGLNELQSP